MGRLSIAAPDAIGLIQQQDRSRDRLNDDAQIFLHRLQLIISTLHPQLTGDGIRRGHRHAQRVERDLFTHTCQAKGPGQGPVRIENRRAGTDPVVVQAVVVLVPIYPNRLPALQRGPDPIGPQTLLAPVAAVHQPILCGTPDDILISNGLEDHALFITQGQQKIRPGREGIEILQRRRADLI